MPIPDKLSARFSDLPLIICGPMVRRVEPEIVSVRVALKEARSVELELYTGYCTPSGPDFPEKTVTFKSEKTSCYRVGEHLHIALAISSPHQRATFSCYTGLYRIATMLLATHLPYTSPNAENQDSAYVHVHGQSPPDTGIVFCS